MNMSDLKTATLVPTIRASLLCFAASLSFALASCDNQKIEVYLIPKEMSAVQAANGIVPPAPAQSADWKKPAGWEEQPLSEMRLGSFKVAGNNGSSADVSVTAFPGEAGGLASNVNRWRGQLQLSPLGEEELRRTIERTNVQGTPVSLIDLASPESSAKSSRILGAVLERPDQTWFVKMTGDPALLEQERKAFLDFVYSFRFAQDPAFPDGDTKASQSATQPKSTNDQ
jgi:hypothetical protein